MANRVWGAPSLSDDIFNNLSKTHHKEIEYTNSFSTDYINSFKASLKGEKYEIPFEEKLVRNNNIDYVSQTNLDDIAYEMTNESLLGYDQDEHAENLFNDFESSDNFGDFDTDWI